MHRFSLLRFKRKSYFRSKDLFIAIVKSFFVKNIFFLIKSSSFMFKEKRFVNQFLNHCSTKKSFFCHITIWRKKIQERSRPFFFAYHKILPRIRAAYFEIQICIACDTCFEKKSTLALLRTSPACFLFWIVFCNPYLYRYQCRYRGVDVQSMWIQGRWVCPVIVNGCFYVK